jgi:hypothetical protein
MNDGRAATVKRPTLVGSIEVAAHCKPHTGSRSCGTPDLQKEQGSAIVDIGKRERNSRSRFAKCTHCGNLKA